MAGRGTSQPPQGCEQGPPIKSVPACVCFYPDPPARCVSPENPDCHRLQGWFSQHPLLCFEIRLPGIGCEV